MFSRLGMFVAGPIIAILVISIVVTLLKIIEFIIDSVATIFGWLD